MARAVPGVTTQNLKPKAPHKHAPIPALPKKPTRKFDDGGPVSERSTGVGGGADTNKNPIPDWVKSAEKDQGLKKGGPVKKKGK
jgi:hypothetical protein